MRVAQVNFFEAPGDRDPDELLEDWYTLELVARAAASAGHEVVVFQAASRDLERGAGGARIRFVAGRALGALPLRLVEEVVAFSPDVIHIHGLSFPRQTAWTWARAPRTPILGQDHANKVPGGWRFPIHRLALTRLSGVSFTAEAQAEPLVRAGLLSPALPVFEVLEGTTTFTPGDPAAARARTGISGDPCVLSVGNLDSNKDPLTVLEAFRRACPALPDARLWFCFQRAPLLNEVQRRIDAEPALKERARLIGARPHRELEHLHRAADFFLSASRSEGSGYSLIEATACGVTPVVSDIPPFRRITGGGRAGALVPLGDPEAMARALVDLAPTTGEEMRRRVRAHFEEALSMKAIGQELDHAYRALRAGAGLRE